MEFRKKLKNLNIFFLIFKKSRIRIFTTKTIVPIDEPEPEPEVEAEAPAPAEPEPEPESEPEPEPVIEHPIAAVVVAAAVVDKVSEKMEDFQPRLVTLTRDGGFGFFLQDSAGQHLLNQISKGEPADLAGVKAELLKWPSL